MKDLLEDLLENTMIVGVAIVMLAAILVGGGYQITKYFGPKQEAVRHQIHTESTTYQQGKIQYLSQLRLDYETAQSENQRAALRRKILTEASVVDDARLPEELRSFIHSLRRQP